MATTKKQTTASTKLAAHPTNDKSNGSAKSKLSETAPKPKAPLSPEQQAEELVKAIRNLIHKKYGIAIHRRDSRIATKVGHAVREKLGLDIQAQVNKRNGNGNGKKFDWQEWNATVFPKLFGRPDALKYDVEVVALFMGKLYDSISETPAGAIADLVEFNVQSLKRRNEMVKEAETEDDDLELDDEDDEDDDEDEIDDALDELDDEEDEDDEDDEDFEVDEEEEFDEEDE